MDYRREVDGLRALAVLPVILFHAGFEMFSGGFVGVDVFFVISGYLITTIIIGELDQGKFSIVNFYERRARRILPALFLVMLLCIVFAWFWLLPSDMKSFSDSLVAVSVFASNILFWTESGYFDTEAELKPLLHTWSLAVEEQYYVLFPLFLMLFWRFGRRWVLVMLGLVFIGSLALGEWGSHAKPGAAFFLLPTRGWELLIGAFAAFYLSKTDRKPFSQGLSEAGGWLGVVLILYSVFTYSKATPFPGFHALVPTLGAVLIILFANQQNTVGRFVGNRAFVGIGLISYSAYLWHQPLFAFARHRSLEEPTPAMFLFLSLLSLVLAYFSWRFVEGYFRNRNNISRNRVFLLAAIFSAFFIGYGVMGSKSNGFLDHPRWDEARRFEEIKAERASGFRLCQEHRIASAFRHGTVCVIGDANAKPSGLLWGDSYAGSAVFGMDAHLRKRQKAYYAVLSDGCPPIPGISRERNVFGCFPSRQQQILDAFNADASLTDLVWVGRFRTVAGPEPFEGYFIDQQKPSLAAVTRKFEEAVQSLREHDKRVVLVLEGPNFSRSIPDYLSKSVLFDFEPEAAVLQQSADEQRQARGLGQTFAGQLDGVAHVDGMALFCQQGRCDAVMDSGNLLVVDGDHISHEASERLAASILQALDQLKSR